MEGKVLVVSKEYNFIVTDMGSDDQIVLGDMLTVFRDGKYVGEAQIEKIYDTMSASTILKETKPGAIQINDKAVVRPK
jgi:archaellum component FlaG (FlaF/FlaG flagellin family)